MSPKKIERLIRTLREQGVEYIKTPEFEIRLHERVPGSVVVDSVIHPARAPSVPEPRPIIASVTPDAAIPPVENTIPHHENQVAKLLRLSDEDLVDKLFPDYTQESAVN